MKFYLKALFFFLAIITMLTLTACGGSSDDNHDPDLDKSLIGTWYLNMDDEGIIVRPNSKGEVTNFTFNENGQFIFAIFDIEDGQTAEEGESTSGKWTSGKGIINVINDDGEKDSLEYSIDNGVLSLIFTDDEKYMLKFTKNAPVMNNDIAEGTWYLFEEDGFQVKPNSKQEVENYTFNKNGNVALVEYDLDFSENDQYWQTLEKADTMTGSYTIPSNGVVKINIKNISVTFNYSIVQEVLTLDDGETVSRYRRK